MHIDALVPEGSIALTYDWSKSGLWDQRIQFDQSDVKKVTRFWKSTVVTLRRERSSVIHFFTFFCLRFVFVVL